MAGDEAGELAGEVAGVGLGLLVGLEVEVGAGLEFPPAVPPWLFPFSPLGPPFSPSSVCPGCPLVFSPFPLTAGVTSCALDGSAEGFAATPKV